MQYSPNVTDGKHHRINYAALLLLVAGLLFVCGQLYQRECVAEDVGFEPTGHVNNQPVSNRTQ